MRYLATILFFSTALFLAPLAAAMAAEADPWAVDPDLGAYFAAETARLRDACLADVHSAADWEARRGEYRRQLLEMLGLDPMPERTDLKATVTGRVEREDFSVENVCFQSRPGLYVTANLWLPKGAAGPSPAVLYVCGHGGVKIDGVSYGNKVSYQHHGAWLARNGFVCLTIDSLQLGEIEATHHGTYRYNMWWWNNRGYTPAGVEAWNCIRALDYLQSRPEVDGKQLGVTGRSGGGAYSWWIASIDDRIKAAVPVAGITDLENHVVDGCVEGHCDCMFMVNTYRWDYPLVAALIAPRALLLSNSDSDRIFPLDGVVRLHSKVREVYRFLNAADQFGLVITPGPHKDTQELQVPAFRWFNKHLKGQEPLVAMAAEKLLEPADLRVLKALPEDQLNTTIHETFVPLAPAPEVPRDAAQWQTMRDGWMEALQAKVFRGWPEEESPVVLNEQSSVERKGLVLRQYRLVSQEHVALPLVVVRPAGAKAGGRVVVRVLDEEGWSQWSGALDGKERLTDEQFDRHFGSLDHTLVLAVPRGIGPAAWSGDERKQIQIRRRFMLLGQTLEGMQVWDVRRAVQAVRTLEGLQDAPVEIEAAGQGAGLAVYAALFEPGIDRLELAKVPATHRDGPILLNVNRFLDMPQAVAMAAERTEVHTTDSKEAMTYAAAVAEKLKW
ncbi:MAG: alpha/beta hydrolase family protein [Thermoguttaceae bacterium]